MEVSVEDVEFEWIKAIASRVCWQRSRRLCGVLRNLKDWGVVEGSGALRLYPGSLVRTASGLNGWIPIPYHAPLMLSFVNAVFLA